MSQENVEIVRRYYEFLNAGALDRCCDLVADTFELVEPSLPDASAYRGPSGLRKWFERLNGAWSDFRWEPHDFIKAAPVCSCPSPPSVRAATAPSSRFESPLSHSPGPGRRDHHGHWLQRPGRRSRSRGAVGLGRNSPLQPRAPAESGRVGRSGRRLSWPALACPSRAARPPRPGGGSAAPWRCGAPNAAARR